MSSLMNKKNLNSRQLQLLQGEMASRGKTSTAMWLMWAFGGGLGAHRFYLGKNGTGIAQAMTAGGFGIWTLIDAFKINGMLAEANSAVESEIIQELMAHSDAAEQTERKSNASTAESPQSESQLV